MTITRDRRILFAFLAVLLIFGLLSWRGEVNTNRSQANMRLIAELARKADQRALATCQRSVVNTTKINTTTHAFIAFIGAIRPQSPGLIAFAKIYRDSLLVVPTC